ncbi:MAG: hypothetical protein IJT66_06425, partial [Clostridia bacterium]|nr:hypothetical protein [Clostridia bacterium]
LDYKIGEYDETAMVSYRITDEELVRSDGNEAGEYLNVYEHLSSATADILNPDVVEQFLQLTHEQYLACFGDRFSKEICGFFTDEPQYYRWQTPYTVMIREYFEKELHEDILDGIGLLFLKKKGYRRFRYRYWSGMQRLMLASFAKMVYDWCDTHHVRLTGHYIEESGLGAQMMCCGGIMPFYEYEHIPGIDWLSRICWSAFPVRQVASVAAQLGRKQVLGEIYAGCGWDVTPRELKTMTDYLYLNGLNRTCQHLLPYSERGNRIHDYPAHYSDINPWVKEYFGDFNEHFNVLGMLIGESEELVHTAVLHPIRSAYFDYDDALQKRGFGVKALDDALLDLTDQLEESAIAYHFLDETLLAKYGDVSGAAIRCGHCTYDALIVPYCLTMDSSTERLLRQYVENGGRILLYRDRPQFLESEPFDYSYLSSNLTWEELLAERPVQVSATGGQLCVTIRKKDDQIFCLALNRSHTEKCCVHLDFHQNERSLKRVFWPDGKEEILTSDFCLNEGESALLLPCDEPAPVAKNRETVICDGTYRVISSDENALTVDKVQISFNGSDYDQPLGIPMAFRRLLKSRYQGKLYLKYGFNVEVVPQTLRFEMYLAETDQVIFNDLPLEKGNRDLAALVRPGRNELVVVCDYQQNDNVYRVLFDPDVTEGLKNCLVYDYELEPLILRGAFGVYSKTGFQRGNCPRVWTADEFVIGELPKSLTGLVQGGYPFFAGKICLETTISCTTDHVCLSFRDVGMPRSSVWGMSIAEPSSLVRRSIVQRR